VHRTNDKPGALVVDLGPIRDHALAMEELQRSWAEVPEATRAKLSRLVWLHPSGDVVVYRPPEAEGDT
jgi:hypothetical protein